MIDDIKINQMPYLGVSKNLMEFFVVIGYDECMLKECRRLLENQKDVPLTIISNVTSDLAYNMFEPSIIIKRVFPDKPPIIKAGKKPPPTSVIFSSCIDSLDGKKKIVNSCYALRFYEQYIDSKKEIYYVPKAFLIYSQYPYFTTYHKICTKLLQYYTSYTKEKIPIEIIIYCFVNYIPSPINGKIILKDFDLNITIPKLTGYPYADFNLANIFNCIPLKDFIKIFILIYLEIELLFFSPDLEKLNMVMFTLYILNYPLTDSSYFWHIDTISEKDVKSDFYTVITGFKGINTKYNPNLDLSYFKSVDFIVDLESDDLIINRKHTKDSKEIVKLLKYIDNIFNKNKNTSSYFLKNFILTLTQRLKDLQLENISGPLFSMDAYVNKTNRIIQEIFYDFIIDTLIILSKDLELDPTSNYPVIIKTYTNPNLSEEENIFLKRSRYTVKYNTYFDLFIRNFSVSEELRVSLLFFDEFVDLKNKDPIRGTKHMPYFQIIDNLYHSKQNTLEFKFTELEREILKNFYTAQLLLSDREGKPELFALDKNLINVFIFHIKNKGYYKSLRRQEESKPDLISKTSILTITRDFYLQSFLRKVSSDYFIRILLVYLFAITFPLLSFTKSHSFLESVLKGLHQIKYFQRYYIFILLKSIRKYYIVNNETGQFPQFNFEKVISFYKTIQNYLKTNFIIQNEEIFVFFKNVLSEKDKLGEIKQEEKKENNEINEINEKKEENDIKEINDEERFIYKYNEKYEYKDIGNNEVVTEKNKLLVFRRSNEIMGCNKIRLDLLSQRTYSLYDYYFTEYNFNIEKLNVDEIINLCINLLFGLTKVDEPMIKNHLYNLIPILKRLRNDINKFNQIKERIRKEKQKMEDKKEEEKDK